eukprot:6175377-Pleurochrysis_carterae.AAC.2
MFLHECTRASSASERSKRLSTIAHARISGEHLRSKMCRARRSTHQCSQQSQRHLNVCMSMSNSISNVEPGCRTKYACMVRSWDSSGALING